MLALPSALSIPAADDAASTPFLLYVQRRPSPRLGLRWLGLLIVFMCNFNLHGLGVVLDTEDLCPYPSRCQQRPRVRELITVPMDCMDCIGWG